MREPVTYSTQRISGLTIPLVIADKRGVLQSVAVEGRGFRTILFVAVAAYSER